MAAQTGSGGDAGCGLPLHYGVEAMKMGGKGGATGTGRDEEIADGGEDGDEPLQACRRSKALQGFQLPPEIALGPNPAIYRAGQNQLMASLYVGNAQASGGGPEDLFKVTNVIRGSDVAGTVEESGCKMTWPT